MQAAGMSEVWREWEGQVAGGSYCLRQYLGGCETSAVFLTEYGEQRAAIKLVRMDPEDASAQLSRWELASKLSHPHLVEILGMGRCGPDERGPLYVVMEYAEEVLSQVLPQRPLTDTEAREMLGPVLSALEYLHGRGLVHGRIKPSNLLSVDGGLKLSSDGICLAGKMSPASDVRSLGMTLVEALTQHPPVWRGKELVAPSSPMLEIARLCLEQYSVSDIQTQLRGAPARDRSPKKQYVVAAAACGVVLAVALAAPKFLSRTEDAVPARPQQPAAAAPAPVPAAVEEKAPAPVTAPGEVVDRVLPDVPQKAQQTIRGQVRVGVRVQADASGSVTGAKIESSGPSRYFAKLALDAARQWRFVPAKVDGRAIPSEWVLRFTFERDGTDVAAARAELRNH
jgi:TonB family protein